ncbi:exonuclease VII large subunit [Bradyrhizobium cajani]|uniref:Exonuclease VII large subunit n=2 Tax=Bradyrhizobium cajani TaxID=1928661 RepID=A0A844THX6_9BRAD|nr:exonuclease VII large subunit [Bradyrhizobium cajani]
MAPRPTPQIAAPARPNAPPAASVGPERPRETLSRQSVERQGRIDRLQQRVQQLQSQKPEGSRAQHEQQRLLQSQSRLLEREQRAQQREQRVDQRQQMVQQRQREMLSRQTTERQTRIDRLQQRVQQLQSQKVEGARAQREQQRMLQAQNRLLGREQRAQQVDLARQQRLGLQAPAGRASAIAAATQAAERGRFAARFREQATPQTQAALVARHSGWGPRQAWRHRHRAAFVAWLGPVFWPYAYSDIFDYTFWSYAYEPGYWAYAYDDFVDTVFWGGDSPYAAYASTNPYDYPQAGGGYRARSRASASPQTLQQLCGTPDKGVTAWPLADIARTVQPTPEQRALLDELKTAAANAAGVFKDSCAETYALTPPGRLRAMMNRISATLEAVKIVRPALENFYNSLSDEQQARFNALGPNVGDRSSQPQEASAESCGDPKSSLTQLPIQRIEAVLHPAGKQKEALDRLSEATTKGVADLQAACPNDVPLTPVGRLEAMQRRLEAMLTTAKLVEPALDEFYATLSSEQKARFNTLQQVASP